MITSTSIFPPNNNNSAIRETISAVAPSALPLLLIGGTREQSESLARLIHVKSLRNGNPFIMTRCGLYRGALLEKRFFGRSAGNSRSHIRTTDREIGHLESAHGGTLYIDQIQHATPLMQDRLLQALREGAYVDPIIGRTIQSDIRIIASMSISLESCRRQQRLLDELTVQLSVVTLEMHNAPQYGIRRPSAHDFAFRP